MTMNFARFIATRRWGDAAGDAAGIDGLEVDEATALSTIPRRSKRPRLGCTWQVDPVGGRPIAVWSTRP